MRILMTLMALALLLPGCKDKLTPSKKAPPMPLICSKFIKKLEKCGFDLLATATARTCRKRVLQGSSHGTARMKSWTRLDCKALSVIRSPTTRTRKNLDSERKENGLIAEGKHSCAYS